MDYKIREVDGEPVKNISITLSGEDIGYVATNNHIAIYLDEKTADSIAFHIGSILQDRAIRIKDLTK